MTETDLKSRDIKKETLEHYRHRMRDIRKLWELYQKDHEADDPDLGTWNEYGLGFDYVPPYTFHQPRGYFRYQISWGGPSEEFRFWVDETMRPYRIEFWFLDWFVGQTVPVKGKNRSLWLEIWEDFLEMELPQAKMTKAGK